MQSTFVSVQSQNYSIKGQMFVDGGGSLSGAHVSIMSEVSSPLYIAFDQEGNFNTSVDWNTVIRFVFEKKGFVTKIIEFSTHVPNHVNKASIAPYDLKVRLFKEFIGVDTAFFKNPVAKIKFDEATNDFVYDLDYSMMVKYQIDKMKENGMLMEAEALRKTFLRDSLLSQKSSDPGKGSENAMIDILNPKTIYPQGVTSETFELIDKTVTRVIVKKGASQHVFLKVKHYWGPEYFFLIESSSNITCISKKAFEYGTRQ